MKNNFHINTVLDLYKNQNLEIINTHCISSWDGADYYGIKSWLYDLIIIYKKNNILKIDLWYREEYYGDKNNPYTKNKTFNSKDEFINSNFYKYTLSNNTLNKNTINI